MSPSKTETSFQTQDKVRSPISLAHVVFRTSNYQEMVSFWETFLGATIPHQDETLTFLRYDDEHHRIAIINVPGTTPRHPTGAGMHHVAFSFENLTGLMESYKQRKARGILPTWCVNHGPTTSIYYQDPDGNSVETQVDNFDTVEGANEFMSSKFFKENAIGTDFDPEDLEKKLDAGVDEAAVKRRVEIGPRGLPEGF